MSTVLFDAPGPRARRRQRWIALAAVVVMLAGAGWVGRRLYDAGSLTPTVFNDTFQNSNVEFLLGGLASTLQAAALAIVTSVAFGLVFAVGRLSERRPIRWPCVAIVEFFRAVPLVLLIIGIWFAYKDAIGTLGCLVVGLTLYNGAVLAEAFRAGIQAVSTGQSEAAYAIGMRKSQVMRIVLIPQAVRFMLPTIVSQCTIILKDTSLGYIILYPEVVRRTKQVANFVPDGAVLTYVTIAAVFVVVNYALSTLAHRLERLLSARGQRIPASSMPAAARE